MSPAEQRTLAAVCATLIPPVAGREDPHGYWRRSAADLDLPALVAGVLTATGHPDDVARLRRLLRLMDTAAFGLLAAGLPRPFAALPPDRRDRALRRLADSPLGGLRQGFQALKRLTAFLWAAAPGPDGPADPNPNWPALGYEPDWPRIPCAPHPLTPLAVDGETRLEADAVVVGSGAGGGVAAAELARRGLSVVVLEAGPLPAPEELGGPEAAGFRNLYLEQGTLSSRDLGVAVLAGACAGGGTTVNWTACIPPPPRLRAEWEAEHGLEGLTGPGFQACVDEVMARIGAGPAWSEPPPGTTAARLLSGCRALGWRHGLLARNVRGCGEDCGTCPFGCRSGAKQSTLRTFLADAAAAGARLIVNCRVERVRIADGRAEGVEARVGPHRVEVRAPRVILAAGAVGTPALLLRSGVENPHVGRHLRLHPVAAVAGFYPEPVRPWRGRLLSAYSDQFVDPETGYGFLIEPAPAHPGLLAAHLPWRSGVQFKEDLARIAHAAPFIALVRDRGEGRVTVTRAGRPRIEYVPAPADRADLLRGVAALIRVHAAAGARGIIAIHARRPALMAPGDGPIPPADLERFVAAAGRLPAGPNQLHVFSAHQMGTARMGRDPRSAVAGPDGQVFGVRGLYICDASAFPTAAGVNPMITVMSLALWNARRIP